MLAHSQATAEIAPLCVVAEPFAPPSGHLLEVYRLTQDEALIAYDPAVWDSKAELLAQLARAAGRPLLDLDTREVTR